MKVIEMSKLKCWTKRKTDWGEQWNRKNSDYLVLIGKTDKRHIDMGKYSVVTNFGWQQGPFKTKKEAMRFAVKEMKEWDYC